MKKSIIITIGIVLILLVLGAWVYLLFFGTPDNSDDVFANLGFGSAPVTTTPTPTEPIVEETTPRIDTKDALRQLTTRPVAGFGFVGTSSTHIRYVERGTGHIYEIEADTGAETRVSGTTIPQVVEAVFSETANSVALISESTTERKVFAGKIINPETNVDFLTLPPQSFSPSFIDDNTLHYARTTEIGTEGYTIDIRDETSTRIFSIPISDISIVWSDEVYVYNKPAARMPGALYKVGSYLNPVTPQSFNFVGGVNEDYFFGSANTDGEVSSYMITRATGEQIPLPINYVPEKCTSVASNPSKLWCAYAFNQNSTDFLEDWYKGAAFSEDVLWNVDTTTGSAQLTSNFYAVSGRYIDVDYITSSHDGVTLLFRNKLDGTLWFYDSVLE